MNARKLCIIFIISLIAKSAFQCPGALINRVKETERFKTYKEDEDLVKFLRDQVIWNEKTYAELAGRTNWIIDREEFRGDILIKGGGVEGVRKELRWYDGTNYVGFEAGALSANQIWILPLVDATVSGQAILSDGAGTLSFGTPSSSAVHDIISTTHDATTQSPTRGSLIYGNSTPLWDELVLGGSGTFLRSDGTDAAWLTIAHGDLSDMPDSTGVVTNHDTRLVAKVQTGTPSTPTPFTGMIWYDTDATGSSTSSTVNLVTKTTTYTIIADDVVVLCSGTFTATLPTAVGITGKMYWIKNIGTGTLTVDGNGSETIDGGTTAVLSKQYEAITTISDGTEWWII